MTAKQRKCPKCGSFNVSPIPEGIICNNCRHTGPGGEETPKLMQEEGPGPALRKPGEKPERELKPRKPGKKRPVELV